MNPSRPLPRILLALLLTLTLATAAPPAAAQEDDDEGLSLEPGRTIAFTTTEGTWMNLDVSPDGSTIVFDLLGDIYTIPVEGGEATRLTSGMAYDVQPVFSPDGTRIAYTSDRSGSDNVWVMNADGSDPEQLTEEREEPVSRPEWDPNGDYLLASRGGDLWLYHLEGGSGLQLGTDDVGFATGAHFAPDGRYVWMSSASGFGGGGLATVNGWQVRRLDRVTGDVTTITASPNGAYRPRISPDGRWLAFGARVDNTTGLRVRDLESGRERWIAWKLDRDSAERPSVLDLMPRYAWLPDSSELVVATGGTFHRFDPGGDDLDGDPIAFSADVEQELGPLIFFERTIDESPIEVRNIRYANRSPAGDRIVFSALAKAWVMDLPDGTPRRLIEQDTGQFQPVFSPDGEAVVWITWDDQEGGHVWRLDMTEGATPVRLTEHPGFYLHPTWSPDGDKVAFLREDAAAFRNIWSRNTGQIVWLPSTGGELRTVASAPSDNRLTFNEDGTRISFVADVGGGLGDDPPESSFVSMRLDGTDRRTLARIRAATWEAVPSPDGRWIAYTIREDVYVAAVPVTPEPPVIGESRGPGPVRRVTDEGGTDVHWADGSDTIAWTYSDAFHSISLADLLAEPPEEEDEEEGEGEENADDDDGDGADADDGDAAGDDDTVDDDVAGEPQDEEAEEQEDEEEQEPEGPQPDVIEIDLTAPRHVPEGTLALVGGRILPMTGEEDVIEEGTIVIVDNRIAAVGPRDRVEIPDGAEVRDVSGHTIIPGLIDLHAHLRQPREVFVEESWAYLANLAYGVTAARDVSTSSDQFAYSELVATGEMIGPRIYSTGRAMTPGNAKIESLDDARDAVRRYKALGTDVIKQYMQPHRRQRQWVAQAAYEEEMNVTNEGGGDLRLNMTQVLDGYSGVEHSLPMADLYDDVIQLVARSRTWYVPTLVVSYGGPTAEWYFYQTTEVHDDDKLSRFTPHDDLDRRTRRGRMYAIEEYHFDEVAEGAAEILEAGGNVGMGAHGEQQGIGAHWETWALQMGGMSNYDALRTATVIGADGLGRLDDLGTLEVGKLADLLVLEADPLEDIRHTNTIRFVIKNGELFDGDTLETLYPVERPSPSIGYRDIGAPPEFEER